MKITTDWNVKLNPNAQKSVHNSVRQGLVDTVALIAGDTIKGSPMLTGHNMRSIQYEMGPGGEVAKKEGEGAVYSTSGYGGFL